MRLELLSYGIVEALSNGILLAASLSKSDEKRWLLVRCLNLTMQPMELRCGTVVGTYTVVKEDEVTDQPSLNDPMCGATKKKVPGHAKTCSSLPDTGETIGLATEEV